MHCSEMHGADSFQNGKLDYSVLYCIPPGSSSNVVKCFHTGDYKVEISGHQSDVCKLRGRCM
jgi:hypothetical protein